MPHCQRFLIDRDVGESIKGASEMGWGSEEALHKRKKNQGKKLKVEHYRRPRRRKTKLKLSVQHLKRFNGIGCSVFFFLFFLSFFFE